MILLTEGASMSRLFDLDWQLLADATLTLIAVFVLYLCMSYFLFNPVRKVLKARQAKIAEELESAKCDQEAAAKLRTEYEGKLVGVNKEAETILSDARRRGMQNEEKIVAEAKEEAASIIDRAQTEAELEKRKMSDDVKREIVTVASAMAGKVVAASIDASVQSQLIDETLQEMGEKTWLN